FSKLWEVFQSKTLNSYSDLKSRSCAINFPIVEDPLNVGPLIDIEISFFVEISLKIYLGGI
ncbi:MAG: hypothetical protein QXR09_03005, partial [Candidatus Aenigmatarchaeota archaeon]